ncbi:MAG: SDR family oxidoreductase [Janthinobacterium lividum]
MSSTDRLVLVTGAASGIGLAIAKRFIAAGHKTLMVDRSPEVINIAKKTAEAAHGRAEGLVADLSVEAEIEKLMQTVQSRHGNVAILVNNAGIHPKKDGGKFMIEEMDPKQWNDVIAINLTAPFLLSRAVLPMMRAASWGRIINISSRGGRTASPVASAHYSATKAGLIGFTRTLALEGAPANITANCVTPGPVSTAMTALSSPEVIAAFAKSVPLGRYGDPDEVAAVVSFLASDDASFMTGAIVDVNGGTFMP